MTINTPDTQQTRRQIDHYITQTRDISNETDASRRGR